MVSNGHTNSTTNGSSIGRYNGVVEGHTQPRDVKTDMNYYLEPEQGGITWYTPGTAMILRRKFNTHPVTIHDLRGQADKFSIHKNSFELCHWPLKATEYTDEEFKKYIYPEAEELYKRVTGCTRVHIFSHLVRRNTVEANAAALKELEASVGEGKIEDTHTFGKVVPARFAHIDHSPKGSRTLLDDNMPDESEKLASTRWGILNIWRPIVEITRDPLGLCDSQTIEPEDLATIQAKLPPKGEGTYDQVSKGKGFESYELRHNPNHKWYYASHLQPEEAYMFKIHDSKKSIMGRSGHTAFVDPEYKDNPPRNSMEIRAFIFWEDQDSE